MDENIIRVCKSKNCRAPARARGYCARCYMREVYRKGKAKKRPAPEVLAGLGELEAFASRSRHIGRRDAVRRLMDADLSLAGIAQSFSTDSGLKAFLDGIDNKLLTLRRDVDYWRRRDAGKSTTELNLE